MTDIKLGVIVKHIDYEPDPYRPDDESSFGVVISEPTLINGNKVVAVMWLDRIGLQLEHPEDLQPYSENNLEEGHL
jgi:hypothetical protein